MSSSAESGRERLLVGAMSGTSADGVDAALVAVTGRGAAMSARLLAHRHRPYDEPLRRTIFSMRAGDAAVRLAHLARCCREISTCYADAVNEVLAAAGAAPRDVSAVAAHGQTLYHAPPDTMQLLDPSLIAAATGCPVVSDFRRADCAAGGQGAPLVPFADYVLFRHPRKTRTLLNIGGIANVAHLRAGAPLEELVAFDTGPGNCVSDHLVRAARPDGPGVDVNGDIAARGVPVFPLLQRMLADEYFSRPPPKSTDGPAMTGVFLRALRDEGRNFPFENLLRTACALTATTIVDAVRTFLDPFPDELIVSGGGVRNATMMALLRQPLGDLPVRTTEELGVPTDAKEAIAFALLGAATLDSLPSNVPSATGARRAVVLGSVTPRPSAEG
ncbi:MAG TPA: anhydro-N-acetylmuramic acid kinase [Vicinamibacterales bacterium]|nr:anhydro-N-acetylmuramic acid kinase [Vicinamibacterales bacterium]